MNRRSKLTALCLGFLFVCVLGCVDSSSESRAADNTGESRVADGTSASHAAGDTGETRTKDNVSESSSADNTSESSAADTTSDSHTWGGALLMVRTDFPAVRHISTTDLAGWQADPTREAPLLLDTRAVEEYEVSHLRGAVLADSDTAIQEALRGQSRDRAIVLYCSVGYRSSDAAQKLQQQGYQNACNLEGSIFAWANEGRPVVRGDEAVSEVHPFNDEWGVLLDQRYHPSP
jgi:rhodanese-related sulfurtransferase